MEAFLHALLHDLEHRATILRDRLAAVPETPDLADHVLAGYQAAESLRRDAERLLADPSLGAPALLENQLRFAQGLERLAKLIESYFLPFVERYGDADRQLTHLCHRLVDQIRWPLPPPLVVAFSSQYYWTVAQFNLVCAPALEGVTLLRLPDLCHELGHILLEHRWAELVGSFVQELADYIEEERQRTDRGQRPPEYAKLYDHLFAQWRDAWLLEFTADMVATYLVGPAFGWQHVRLCAGEGQAVYHPALGETSTHPADEARLQGVLVVLSKMGSTEGPQVKALWDSYTTVSREDRPADYEVCYPQSLLESLALHVIEGCQMIGLRNFREDTVPGPAAPDIPILIRAAWERFLRDVDGYFAWEEARLAELRSAMAGNDPGGWTLWKRILSFLHLPGLLAG